MTVTSAPEGAARSRSSANDERVPEPGVDPSRKATATLTRRRCRQIMVGSVPVGGDAPVTVQSMTTTKTRDVEATLAQIYQLAAAGADIVRCTCNEAEAAAGLAQIVPRSPVPIVADVHNNYRMALAAIEAGVHCLRLNPGNIRNPRHIKLIAAECRDRHVPIRIGVNAGSLDPDLYRRDGTVTPEALVESACRELAWFAEVGFDTVKISVKASDVRLMIEAYRLLAEAVDHPLHLGVTEAGPPPEGLVKATAGLASLLADGIGDTIRYSLTADPVEEARAGRVLLEALGLRERRGLDLIACPSCGRAEVDVIDVARRARAALADLGIPVQVAVMGCVVNGPGEARGADLGIAAGRGRGHLFVRGQVVAVVEESEMVEALVEWARRIHDDGIDMALRDADTSAAGEAEVDRQLLLGEQGPDVNGAAVRIGRIKRKLEESARRGAS
ncbi:MAG: flavodoxin-dependent (E)-4-hydroxy-3-methylbut-2-enyl-diphosphate synthase [Acidimicrobiales bacterium]|nr:flavodoxin-dependent (E)-4-hydroxy-3-methylbut-2-enyl-diphosphate synthase [Acidimicrobiales bacterium]